MIIYPTETIYALGVPVLNEEEMKKLFLVKNREEAKRVTWLVRNLDDIKEYAEVSLVAEKLAKAFLPGPLTLVLSAKESVPKNLKGEDGTVGFRISSDPVAQKIISEHMSKGGGPLTCTSANLSSLPTLPTPAEIISQLGENAKLIDKIYDDGQREGKASTVVRVMGDEVEILREGSVTKLKLYSVMYKVDI